MLPARRYPKMLPCHVGAGLDMLHNKMNYKRKVVNAPCKENRHNASIRTTPLLHQCWAYTRRYFERAGPGDGAAQEALRLIGALYRVEQQIREKGLEGQANLEYRSPNALPIVEAFFGWCP